MSLEKAKLIALDSSGKSIEFMFNPTELQFSRSMNIEQSEGARTQRGQNKTSFKHPNPYSLKISNVILDTYESGKSVLADLEPFTKAVQFLEGGGGSGGGGSASGSHGNSQNKRPPIYLFTWGQHKYLKCFIKTLGFKLTLFLPDGTPVRAILDLSLEQVDDTQNQSNPQASQPTAQQRQDGGRPIFY